MILTGDSDADFYRRQKDLPFARGAQDVEFPPWPVHGMFEGSERVAPISYGAVEEALLRRTELKVLLWAFNLTVRGGG